MPPPPISEKQNDDETERRPTLSLSRLKVRASHIQRTGATAATTTSATTTSFNDQHQKQRKRKQTVPLLFQDSILLERPFAAQKSSFREERKRLDELFHSSSSSSSSSDDDDDEDDVNNNDSNNKSKKRNKIKKPSITRRRRYRDMPIPSFSVSKEQADEEVVSTDTEDEEEDDDDLDLLLGDGKPVFTNAKPKAKQQSNCTISTAATACITAASTCSSGGSRSSSPKPTNNADRSLLDCKENEGSTTILGQETTTTRTTTSSSQGLSASQNVVTTTNTQRRDEKTRMDEMKNVKEEEKTAAKKHSLTEADAVLAAAEQFARKTLDQSNNTNTKFNMKLVYAELDKSHNNKNVTGKKTKNCWTDIVKRNKVKEHVLNCLGPSEEQLLVAVDHAFQETTNIETSTVKQMIARVQARFPIPLSSLMRERIKRRLKTLITERIQHRRVNSLTTTTTTINECNSTAKRQSSSPQGSSSSNNNNNNSSSLEVSQEALFQAVDQTFLESNIETCTLKQAVANVQARFSVPFSVETCKLIKQRLQLLINKEIQPTTPSMPLTKGEAATKQKDNIGPLLSHSTNNNTESKGSVYSNKVTGVQENSTSRKSCLEEATSASAACVASVHNSKTSASQENATPTVIQKPIARKARTRKPKKDETATDTMKKDKVATRGNRKRKASCQLCRNCPCTLSTTTTTEPADNITKTAIDLAKSDAAIEKVLIKQLQKAEKMSEQYDNQLDTVRRALKKHRREMWKKLEANDTESTVSAAKKATERFLPDAGEFEQNVVVRYGAALGIGTVQNAQSRMFGGGSITGSTFQPTLTQIFRGEEKNDMEIDQPENGQATSNVGQLETIDEQPALELENDEGKTNLLDDQLCGDGEQNGSSETTGSGDNEDVEDDEDDLGLSTVERIPFSRVEHYLTTISGGESATESVWQSMLNGNYACSWDKLFADPCDDEDDNTAMDDLLGLLGGEEGEGEEKGDKNDSVKLSMLSPRGKHLAETIIKKVSNSPRKLSDLEHDCPSWKENVLFGACQNDSKDVSDALEGVRMSKKKLLEARAAILKSIDRKLTVLGVFEDVLHQSLASRLAKEAK